MEKSTFFDLPPEDAMIDEGLDEFRLEPMSSAAQQRGSVPFDLESGFEPQTRARSNTWPLPRPEGYVDANTMPGSGKEGVENGPPSQQNQLGQAAGLLPVKKNSSRRNAWGNLSYADLITQAITSAPEKRLTLSQIYEWMVQNIAYFKDKGDSNSSAGWKNSIRHNLSLHNRFMRVQNEGTGKSSWWMINPDAKPGKSARRRATSMETSKFEKRRGRAKKKVEALRNGSLQADATPSPSSSVSEGLDLFPDSPLPPTSGFQLSPDFRPRASSNASSCGRLSPIPAALSETEWTPTYPGSYSPEQLAGNLAESMKLEPFQSYPPTPNHQQQTGPPPSYYDAHFQRTSNALRTNSSPYGLPPTPQSSNQPRCPMHPLQPCACSVNMSPVSGLSPSYQPTEPASNMNAQQSIQFLMQPQRQQQPQPPTPPQQQQQQQQQQPQQKRPPTAPGGPSPPESPVPSTMMGQIMGALANPSLLDDFNINFETLHSLDCNVDEVIKHELSMDGSLDFNFQQGVMSSMAQVNDNGMAPVAMTNQSASMSVMSGNAGPAGVYVSTNAATPAVTPSWVH